MKQKIFIALFSLVTFAAHIEAMVNTGFKNSWRDPKITFVAKADTLPDYSSRDEIVEYLFTKLAEKDKKAATSYKEAYTAPDAAESLIIKMYHENNSAVLLYGLSFVHKMERYALIHNPASSTLQFTLSDGRLGSSREVIMRGVRLMKGLAVFFLQQHGIYANDYSNKCGGEEIDAADNKYFDLIYDSFDLFLSTVDPKHPLYDSKKSKPNDDLIFGAAYNLDVRKLIYSNDSDESYDSET